MYNQSATPSAQPTPVTPYGKYETNPLPSMSEPVDAYGRRY